MILDFDTWKNMTEEELRTWLMEQAKRFLKYHGIENADVQWLAFTHNMVFKVIHETGEFILKAGVGTSKEIEVLNHIGEVDNLPLPQIVRNNKGEQIVGIIMHYFGFVTLAYLDTLAVGGKADTSPNSMLVRYVEGKTLTSDSVTPENVESVGFFLARFHNASPDYLQSIKAGYHYSTMDADGLFGKSGVYRLDKEAMQIFTDEQLAVMDAVAEQVKAAMDELGTGEGEFGLIHGDLLLQNILFHEGEVRALDFEYCGWGYYLYDLTPLLWQLKPQARYPELEQALWDGYTSIRPLSSRHRELLETFIAGRQVASMRWVAANRHNPAYQGKVEGIMAQRAAELQGFLDTGILRRK